MSYDIRFRRRALEYWNDGHSKRETAEVFKLSTFTLQQWKNRLNETGDLKPKERCKTWKKIEPAKLKEYIAQHPDAYLKEIGEAFGCSDVAILKALKRLRISRKKNNSFSGG